MGVRPIHENSDSRPAPSGLSGRAAWHSNALHRARELVKSTAPAQRRDEYWKFTDPEGLTGSSSSAPPACGIDGQSTAFDRIDRKRIVLSGGGLDRQQSDSLADAHIRVDELKDIFVDESHWCSDLFGTLEARGQAPVQRPFALENRLRVNSGLAIRVRGRQTQPIEIAYNAGESAAKSAYVRHVLKLDPDSEVTLLETGFSGTGTNTVVEVEIGDGARFNHVRIQNGMHQFRSITHMFARLGAGSSMKSFTATADTDWLRNECVIDLAGEGGAAHVSGAAIGNANFHQDDTLFVKHLAPNCESRQVFKKVLRNGAVGVFQGKILVEPAAQKTDGYQLSQALLLDDDAQFLAKPELEIYADDVACSHGSTSGGLDENALFYLRSRGIPESDAKGMLAAAFLTEAVEEIEDSQLAEAVMRQFQAWLPA